MTIVNPFDLRAVLLAKHAQHVVLVHFPIALFMTGVGLDLLSRGKRDSQLASAAYLNISIVAVTVIPTALTGVMAWHFALDSMRRTVVVSRRRRLDCGRDGDHVMVDTLAITQVETADASSNAYSG